MIQGFYDELKDGKKKPLCKTITPKREKIPAKFHMEPEVGLSKFNNSPQSDKENMHLSNLETHDYTLQTAQTFDKISYPEKPVKKANKPRNYEDYSHQPILSKTSLIIANNMGNAFERLTSKSKSIKKKPKRTSEDELSFTPKINSKSLVMVKNKKDRGVNRFRELHDQVIR